VTFGKSFQGANVFSYLGNRCTAESDYPRDLFAKNDKVVSLRLNF
jgi:hypothetical protein